MTTIRTLIQVIPYEFTGEEIAKANRDFNIANQTTRICRHHVQILPDYCFGDVDDTIQDSVSYYQFFDNPEMLEPLQKSKKVILFDMYPTSSPMSHEFSEMGVEWVFTDCGNSSDFRKILEGLASNRFVDFGLASSPIEHFFVFDITYTKSYDHYSGGWEYETEIELVGHLDRNMQLVEIKKQ
jgi:hypothetical protein